MASRARQLLTLGQSVWLDYIHRRELLDGTFARQVDDMGVVGVTSNPTIFQQAFAGGGDYDASIERHAARGLSGAALFEAIAIEDIQTACDRLAGVFAETGGRDGRVSLEVDPHAAHDTARTIADARRLHAAVDRPGVMIKVPATREGLPAITMLTAEGYSINVTLIFTLERHREVMDAFITGLEMREAQDQPLDGIRSVASFFVSRVDSKLDAAIDQRLATLPPGATERAELEAARGRAAVANARRAYRQFVATFASPRWHELAARGAHPQRPLWASTSTKNPAYPDTLYVDELVGPDTVNTMPPKTLAAFNDHGALEPRLLNGLDAADRLFARLPELGIPIDAKIAELEAEGVAAFVQSFDALLETLEGKRLALAGGAR